MCPSMSSSISSKVHDLPHLRPLSNAGATNLATAAAYAYLGAFPMLMITGQKPVLKSKQVGLIG